MSSSPLILEGTPAGNDLDIQRDVPGISPTDPVVLAWLTIKERMSDTDLLAALQKQITTTLVGGVGHIAQDGGVSSGNGTASLYFQLTKAQTTALGWSKRFYWDIKVLTGQGKEFTTVDPDTGRTVGRLLFRRPVRQGGS